MTKNLYPFLFAFALTSQAGQAQNKIPLPTCEELLDVCRDSALSFDESTVTADKCQECNFKCSKAKEQCYNENDDYNLDSASASYIHCVNICNGLGSK